MLERRAAAVWSPPSRIRRMKGNHKYLVWLLITLLLGVIAYALSPSPPARASGASPRKVLFYQDSMHPWIKSDQPGKCTICNMDLTPICEGDKGFAAGKGLVVLNSNAITVLHVQTEALQRRALSRTLRVAGTLEANETRKAVVSAPARARVEALAVDYAGVEVEQGQKLVTLFSPDVGALQRVLFSARPPSERTNVSQVKLASESYMAYLSAPLSGVVLERNVYSGQYVAEGDRLLTIADASVLWFRFDVYESQLPWFKLGQNIEVTVSAVPGKVFPATISFIEPTLNDATRTVKVRADIKNPAVPDSKPPRRLLRFGMYADGRVRAEIPDVLTVPRTAILFPGNSAYAYVDNGAGAYERRRVKLGRQGDIVWEVLDGLAEGERVVTSGNVLLDAQAQFAQGGEEVTEAPGQPASVAGASTAAPASSPTPARPRPALAADDPKQTKASSPAASVADHPGATTSHADMAMPKEMDTTEGHGMAAVPAITQPQQQTVTNSTPNPSLTDVVARAADISRALAADDLAQFNQHVARVSVLLAALQKKPGPGRPVEGNDGGILFLPRHGARVEEDLLKRLSVISPGEPAKDLAEARARFLPFSTMMVELVQQLKKAGPTFSALKIYYCPMAPKPGLWMQCEGPLANPFFGSAMLRCGKEVQ